MSGKIRKALGPIHGRIKQHIIQYKEIAPEGFDPSKLSAEEKAKKVVAIKHVLRKLTKAIADAETYLEKWEHLIRTSSPEEKIVENEAKKKFFEDYGNIPDTLKLAVEVIDDAEHLLVTLGASNTSSSRSESERSNSLTLTPVSTATPPVTTTTITTLVTTTTSTTTSTITPIYPAGQVPVTTTITTIYNNPITTNTLSSATVTLTNPITTGQPSPVYYPNYNVQYPAINYVPPTTTTASQATLSLPHFNQHSAPIPPFINVYPPPSNNPQLQHSADVITKTVPFTADNHNPFPPTHSSYLLPASINAPIPSPLHTPVPGYITPENLKTMVANFNNFQPLTQAELALMPHIKLEKFTGDKLKFYSWWQLFFSIVHSKALDNVVKFQILVNHLSGTASELLSGYEITSSNYLTAINTLLETYGSLSPSRHSLRTQLFRMQPINGTRHPEDIAKCRKLITLYRQLVNHGDACDNEWAGQAVEEKLPRSTLSDLYREIPEDVPLIAPKIIEKLEKIIRHEERVENTYRENRPNESVRKPFLKPFIGKIGVANAIQPQQQQYSRLSPYRDFNNQRAQKNCFWCHCNHYTTDCTKYSTPQQRKDAAQKLKACFNCLKPDHSVKDCFSQKTCRICQQRHHTALCTTKRKPFSRDTKTPLNNATPPLPAFRPPQNGVRQSQQKPPVQKSPYSGQQPHRNDSFNRNKATTNVATGCLEWEDFEEAYEFNEDDTIQTATFTSKANEDVLKACFKIQVCNPEFPEKTVECIAVLDTCSTHSYCDPSLTQQLNLPCVPSSLSINGIGQSQQRVEAEKCTLGLVNNDKIATIEAFGWKDFMSKVKRIPLENVEDIETDSNLPHPLLDKVSLLIGQDKALSFLVNSELTELPSGHKLIDIGIGKFVCGQGQLKELKKTVKTFATVLKQLENGHDHNLTEKIDWQHAVDSLPFTDNPKNDDAEIARTILHDNITIDPESGRIKVPLLFKEGVENLPSNLGLSTATLFSVWNKYKDQPEILQKIDDIFEEQRKLMMLQKVGDLQNETDLENGKHYLPHFPVLTPSKKTTKVRVVVNGSAKTKRSKSLNDYIFPGPSTVPDMAAVLLRFRVGKIAISSDIEKAFLQISLEETHRDYVRILWLKDFKKPPTRDNIVIYRYARVPFGVNCSPYLLGGSIAYHLSNLGTLIAEEIKRNIYVDNCLVYAENVEEAISKYREIREIFSDIKMNIREFVSNSKEFNEFLEKETGDILPPDTKILGVHWHIKEDTLKVKLPDPQHSTTNTKRKCLKVLASVPDIFGILLPIILIAKLFFQNLWKSKVSWDEKIDNSDWIKATQGWKNFEFSFNRRMINFASSKKELHIFSDASGEAAAAVAYIKEYTEDGCHITLIFAKNRLKPLNTEKNGKSSLTIPRMELIALLIAVRMALFLVNALDMQFISINIWTDSQVCLQWLQNPPEKDVFVKNRIFEILEKGSPYIYRHISGNMNPADVASRGCTPEQLLVHPLWWHGPALLKTHFSTYPIAIKLSSERRDKHIFTLATLSHEAVIDISKFNSFHKLLGTLFFTFTYITFLKIKTGKPLQHPWILFQKKQKTAINLLFIEHWLIKQVQITYPPDEKDNKKFRIKKDEHGIYRCYGRLSNSELPDTAKYPIWLPRKAALTKLIIGSIHRKLHHSGTRITLAALRNDYWVSQGRKTVENQIHKCLTCRRELAKPFYQPSPPPLPKNRVTQSRPFQHVGIDYLGPVTVKKGGNEREKRWVASFTCLATRVLHLELVENLTTATFLHALRRFIARRGQPNSILSDNATTFRLAALVETQARHLHHQDPEILDYCANNGISWKNIPELSPWFGGMYERLIGLTKIALKRAIGRHIPQQFEFITYLYEAEALINSRPLTYIQENEPTQQILRPIDFLLPTSKLGTLRLPRDEEEIDDPTWKPDVEHEKEKLVHLWKSTQKLLDSFWNLWKTEYLQSLRENDFLQHKGPRSQTIRSPKLGEIVIIGEPDLQRGQWRLGKIIDIPNGKIVRTVKLQMGNKRILTRPVKLCYPLEISETDTNTSFVTPQDDNTHLDPDSTPTPTLRRSARLRQSAQLALTTFFILSFFTITYANPLYTKTIGSSSENATTSSPLLFFTAKCVQGGVKISPTLKFQHLEICSLFFCTAYNKPPDECFGCHG